MLSVSKALSYDKDAIGIGRKGTIDNPYILRAPFWTVDTLFYAVPKENIDLNFVFGIFQNIDWKKKDESTGVPSLSKTVINGIDIYIPNRTEQRKIGLYLINIDKLITLHQCMYFLRHLPSLHSIICKTFLYFPTVWIQRKLNEYLKTSTNKNRDEVFKKTDVLSVSGDYGIVNQIEFQGRSFAGASVANYGIVNTYDIVYTKSPLSKNPYGIIKTNTGKPGIVSTLYAVYHPKTENVYPIFIQIYYEQDARLNHYLRPLCNKGAKNDMKVTSEMAISGKVRFPQLAEQKEISKVFLQLDNLLTLHQRKVEQLQTLKKGLLQQLFV